MRICIREDCKKTRPKGNIKYCSRHCEITYKARLGKCRHCSRDGFDTGGARRQHQRRCKKKDE